MNSLWKIAISTGLVALVLGASGCAPSGEDTAAPTAGEEAELRSLHLRQPTSPTVTLHARISERA
jgi:hypothetical protein